MGRVVVRQLATPKFVNSRSRKAAASASAGSPAGNFEQTQLSDHYAWVVER
jgi:hypothetical protein